MDLKVFVVVHRFLIRILYIKIVDYNKALGSP